MLARKIKAEDENASKNQKGKLLRNESEEMTNNIHNDRERKQVQHRQFKIIVRTDFLSCFNFALFKRAREDSNEREREGAAVYSY